MTEPSLCIRSLEGTDLAPAAIPSEWREDACPSLTFDCHRSLESDFDPSVHTSPQLAAAGAITGPKLDSSAKSERQDGEGAKMHVLVVDDEALYLEAIARELRRRGFDCSVAATTREALAQCSSGKRFEVLLLDHKLPDGDGIRLIPSLRASQPHACILVMTAYETIANAILAMRLGAEDYIVKQTSIKPIVQRLLELRERAQLRESRSDWNAPSQAGLIGRSAQMRELLQQLEMVSQSPHTTVLLTGETGVGKEVAARCLHRLSPGADAPFVPIDCVSLPATLIESMLFGHEKGAFTNADQVRLGAFAEAGCGTIFLDEIGEMDMTLQAKLLRVLESRCFQRLGSVKEYPVSARIVAATHRDLLELVKEGKFRFDLYQRLAIFPIEIPPLRQRNGDILLLARHFVEFFAGKLGRSVEALSEEVERLLTAYDYPGNVRELKNAIERAVILATQGRIEVHHLPQRLLAQQGLDAAGRGAETELPFIPGVDTLESLERKMINRALQSCHGHRTEAAKMLGISRFQLLRRMEKYGLQDSEPSSD